MQQRWQLFYSCHMQVVGPITTNEERLCRNEQVRDCEVFILTGYLSKN